MATLGERLKALRKEKNLRQAEMADLLDLSTSTVGMYEQDRRDPDTKTLNFLADYFGVTVDYLLGRTDDRWHDQVKERGNHIDLVGLNEEEIKAVRRMVDMLRKK